MIPATSITCSPNDKLLVCLSTGAGQVFELPYLRKIFELNVRRKFYAGKNILTFSPDSSYFLYNSIKTCICISKQEELDFIPHGPNKFNSCSFSPCGTELVISHDHKFIDVCDVKKKDLLVRVEDKLVWGRSFFSNCNLCFFQSCNTLILQFTGSQLCSRDVRTSQKLDIHNICSKSCLTNDVNFQIIQPTPRYTTSGHFHLTTGEIIIVVDDSISKKLFRWKGRPCLLFSHYPFISFLDVIRPDLIYKFRIDCKHFAVSPDDFPIKLDGTNFLFFFKHRHAIVVSFQALQEHTVESFQKWSLK